MQGDIEVLLIVDGDFVLPTEAEVLLVGGVELLAEVILDDTMGNEDVPSEGLLPAVVKGECLLAKVILADAVKGEPLLAKVTLVEAVVSELVLPEVVEAVTVEVVAGEHEVALVERGGGKPGVSLVKNVTESELDKVVNVE